MGIENRGYMQSDASGNSYGGSASGGAFDNIVKTLIIINVVVFIAQSLFVRDLSFKEFLPYTNAPAEGFRSEREELEYRKLYDSEISKRNLKQHVVTEWFILDPNKIMRGQVWRLLTYAFIHSTQDPFHIVFNMMILYMAGRKLQYQLGTREFLYFYLMACICAGAFYLLWGAMTNSLGNGLGASGGVSAVMMTYALIWPQERWLMMMIFPMPVIVIVLLYAGYDLMPMIQQLMGRAQQDNVAHSAHIGGLLFGYLYHKNRWQVSNWGPDFSKFRGFKRKPKLRVHRPEPEPTMQKKPIPPDVAAQVDQLLAKIHEQGEASLTDQERTFLSDASRKYRDR